MEFSDLQAGQFIKICGKVTGMGRLLAVEITGRDRKDLAKIIGVIQNVDSEREKIEVLHHKFSIKRVKETSDLEKKSFPLAELKAGINVKLEGKCSESGGFLPTRIQTKETLEFNIEEVEGEISRIDKYEETFVVNGVDIFLNRKTVLLAQ